MASCLIGGCVVKLPGNLDAGDDGSTDNGDMDDGPDPTAEGSSDDGPDPTAEGSTGGDDMPGDGDGDGGDDMPGDGDGDGDGDWGLDGDGCQAAVDILMVVDNSGSMELLQRRLAESMPSLFGSLEGVDWRLAITTTDVGNPWCPPGTTTPEMGAFQLRACNEHLDDFLFGDTVDVKDVLCNDICPHLPGEVYTLPTTTDEDPVPSPRPWMERIDGASNLAPGISETNAALCLVPQGVNGCGFEQPLEAMALALDRATTPGLPESGFLRDDASLLVVILTNEADCSAADDSIFDADGNKVFFSDPSKSFPSSAVCWNAGVSCSGAGPTYDDCVATDYDINGNPTMAEQAVLHPLGRYVDLLNELEQDKRALDPGADVGVLVIAGLGVDESLNYTDVSQTDPDYQESFGIGPGCTSMDPLSDYPAQAMPPVRLREFGAAMSEASLASICADNYVGPFLGMRDRLVGECD